MIHKSIPKYNVNNAFALSNAIISGNSNEIILTYKERIEDGDEPIFIINTLTSVFKLAVLINSCKKNGMYKTDIADTLKIHPFRVQKISEILEGKSTEKLYSIIDNLSKLDKNIKTGKIDKKIGLDLFILELIK